MTVGLSNPNQFGVHFSFSLIGASGTLFHFIRFITIPTCHELAFTASKFTNFNERRTVFLTLSPNGEVLYS